MSLQRMHTDSGALALYGLTGTRTLEQSALAQTATGELMQQAGRRVAELAMALAPHARHFGILCGPGNNGGDGLVAATHLHQRGRERGWRVSVVFSHGVPEHGDAAGAWTQAQTAGLSALPEWPAQVDVAIDAVFGIGARTPLDSHTLTLLPLLQAAPVLLSVDAPTGLNIETGHWCGPIDRNPGQQRHTLSLLTLKPGLFTGSGRDWAGQLWWDDLGTCALPLPTVTPDARLSPAPALRLRPHAAHKGSFGQVTVIGGQVPSADRTGMLGAAILAARAALHAGAGRVYLCPLGEAPPSWDAGQADVMLRSWAALQSSGTSPQDVWLAGCGGGQAIEALMPALCAHPGPLVLDADALNAIAADPALQTALRQRAPQLSVLTPHPLEAARLLNTDTKGIQSDRLLAAQALAERYAAVVVLKGSGTIVAAPGLTPIINPTGNARLAIAGTGDVLAGLIAARLARDALSEMASAHMAVAEAVWLHGRRADVWPPHAPLTASALACSGDEDL